MAGLALTLAAFCLANHLLELGVFGDHGGRVLTLSIVLLGVTVLVCAPNTEEEQEITRKWRGLRRKSK